MLARDPQSIVFYDSNGQFVGVRRPGSGKPIQVEGLNIIVDDVVGSTGLEIKSDPGVPWVYAGDLSLAIATNSLLLFLSCIVLLCTAVCSDMDLYCTARFWRPHDHHTNQLCEP